MLTELNWLGVIAAGFAAFVVGAIWYSPPLFAKPWMKALGKRPEEMGKPGPAIANAAVMNLIGAFTLALLFQWLEIVTLGDALVASLTVAVGFIVSNQVMRDRFHGMSFTVSLINGANTIVVYAVMGLVLGLTA